MSLAGFSLRRPYTIFAVIALMCLLAGGAALRMPTDIFPEINIPVVSVVWTYNGMSATDIQNRILTLHERQLASLVDDISRIEANSYDGVGVDQGLSARRRGRQPGDFPIGEAARWSCSNTCRATSRRRWSCDMARPTCRSSSSACRATRCRIPS